MNQMLLGGIAVASLLAGLFFLRFWRNTKDPFFLCFALSFWLQGLDRIVLGAWPGASEDQPVLYGLRIISYGLIVVAIWGKNRRPPGPKARDPVASPPTSP
jgi:hypothetical protein